MNKLEIISQDEQYINLIEDCRAIIGQRLKNSRIEIILAYGEIGERICSDEFYKKNKRGNLDFVSQFSKDIGVSYSEIQRAIQFYEKFLKKVSQVSETTIWGLFEEGENISWAKIKQNYLPVSKESSVKNKKDDCKHCALHCG